MIDAFRNSLIGRLVLWLFAPETWRVVASWYAGSVLGRIGAWFGRYYADSTLKRLWEGYIARQSGVYSSLYRRFFTWLHTLCSRFGAWFMPILRQSLVYSLWKGCGRVWKKLRTRFIDDSVLGKALAWLNFRRFLLLCLGFYLPIDWLIRDVLTIPVLSSVWDELFFLGAVGYVIACRITGKSGDKTHVSPLDIPILLFCAVGFALLCVNSPILSVAIDGYRATVQYMLWFFVAIRLMEDDTDAVVLTGSLGVVVLGLAVHGIYQYIIAAPIPSSWVTSSEAGVRSRAFSIVGSPNILGSILVMTAPVVAAFAYSFHSMWKKVLTWCAVFGMCLCLLVTFSRGAWFGMVVAVLVFALVYDRRLFFPIGVAVPVAMFIPSIANRILYLFTEDFAKASAVGGRAQRWEVGYRLLNQNPWTGFGLGRFGGAVAMQNQTLDATSGLTYFYMDNYYLKTATEMGYPGLIAFLILIAAVIWLGLRCAVRARRSDTSFKALPAGILAGLGGVAAHCYFENIFEVPYMMALFWSLAAVLMYFGYLRKQ